MPIPSQSVFRVVGRLTPARCLPLFLGAAWLSAYKRFADLEAGASERYRIAATAFLAGLAAVALLSLARPIGRRVAALVGGRGWWPVVVALTPALLSQTLEIAWTSAYLLIWTSWARTRDEGPLEQVEPAQGWPWLVACFALEAFRQLPAAELTASASYRGFCLALLAGSVASFLTPEIGARLVDHLRAPRRAGLLLPVFVLVLVGPPALVRSVGWAFAWGAWAAQASYGDLRWAWRPVLVVGALLRLGFVVGAPWPYWGYDALGYLGAVHSALLGQESVLDVSRTPVFPAFALALLWVGRSYFVYLVVAHALGLAIAWWVGRSVRSTAGEAAGLACFAWLALFPKILDYEHALGAEVTFVFTLSVTAALALRYLVGGQQVAVPLRACAALGLFASLTVLSRPAGLAILPPLVLAGLVARWRLLQMLVLCAAIATPLGGWASYNKARHGFFGLSRIGDQALFGVAGHLVDPDSPGFEELKEEMRPGLARHNAFRPFWNPHFNWLLFSPAGPLGGPKARAMDHKEYYDTVRAISLQAIRERPAHYALRCAFQFWVYVLQPEPYLLTEWPYPLGYVRDPRVHLEPPDARRFVDTPALRSLASLPAGPSIYDGVVRMTTVLTAFPFQLAEHPIVALLMCLAALPHRRWRAPLVFLGGAALALIVVVCVMGEPLHRYHIQTVPLLVVAQSLLIGRVVELGSKVRGDDQAFAAKVGQAQASTAHGSMPSGLADVWRTLTARWTLALITLIAVTLLAWSARRPPWADFPEARVLFDPAALAQSPPTSVPHAVAGESWRFVMQEDHEVVYEVVRVEGHDVFVVVRTPGGSSNAPFRWEFYPLDPPAAVLGVGRDVLRVSGREVDCLVLDCLVSRAFGTRLEQRTWVAWSDEGPVFPGVVRVEGRNGPQSIKIRELVEVRMAPVAPGH